MREEPIRLRREVNRSPHLTMVILHLVMMVFTAILQPTKSEVHIPLKQYKYLPSSGLNITCFVQNESFIGWFNKRDVTPTKIIITKNPWIPVVVNRAEVKDKPAVVIETDSSLKKTCTLIFPKGLNSKSVGGKYACFGEKNIEIAEVYAELNLDSVQTEQTLNFHMGQFEKIKLGAYSYPPARFEWRKNDVAIAFSQGRLTLQNNGSINKLNQGRLRLKDDGSIHIFNVRKSDGGVYDVRIIWKNRVVKRARITVKVIDSRVTIFPSKHGRFIWSPLSMLFMKCFVRNETFVGWFKAEGNIKFPVVNSIRDVKDKPAVVSYDEKHYYLVFPRGLDARSAGGKYVCKGETSEDTTNVYANVKLDALQTRQSLQVGMNGTIVLGAFSYPPPRFKWRKDSAPIEFNSEGRLFLQDDGSIRIFDIQKSDAGVYKVKIKWEHKVVKRIRITVTVIDSRVVIIPSKQGRHIYSPSSKLSMMCLVQNETFVGWFKAEGNIKFPVVNSLRDVKDKPVVVSHVEKYHELVLPRGLDTSSAGGKYVCKGETSEDTAVVNVKVKLGSLQTRQSLHRGSNGTIFLGAFSYPRARFEWRKDSAPIDFSQGRLTLQDDGSIHILNVRKSDAGVYVVKIIWENRVVKFVRITVKVIVSRVYVPFSEITLRPSFDLSIVCNIKNEKFIGWFKDTNIKIPVVPSSADVKDKPAVVIATTRRTRKAAWLMLPKGSSASNVGTYICKGGVHQAVIKVFAE